MAFSKAYLLSLLIAYPLTGATTTNSDTLSTDFCIIGGGSSGTYAAIRLQQLGKTVTLIERDSRLGGHVNTFRDPVTGSTFDYGVISFDNISAVTDYFEYLGVALGPSNYPQTTTISANFATGSVVPKSALPQGNLTAALLGYLAQLDKYPYLSNGFNLPDPIPEDFLITWGEFLEKYDLGGMAYTIFTYLEGLGNILAQPTLYVMKYLAEETAKNILGTGGGFLSTTAHNNQALYDKALAKLGSHAYISSNITHVSRLKDSVKTFVSTPSGPKLIKSSKLIIAIQPKLENLEFLDVSIEEATIFRKFSNNYYWDAVIRNSGIPDGVSAQNVDLSAPYGIPPVPGIYGFNWVGVPSLQTAYYSSNDFRSDEEVKGEILSTLAKLVKSLGYTTNGRAELVGFHSHAPFELKVSPEEVENGFYDNLNALQGQRNTFWTGATWQLHDSSEIWNWTEYTLLPQLLA